MSGEKKTLELDKYEYGVIFHALKDERRAILSTAPVSKAHMVVLAAPSLVTMLFIVTLNTLKIQETM